MDRGVLVFCPSAKTTAYAHGARSQFDQGDAPRGRSGARRGSRGVEYHSTSRVFSGSSFFSISRNVYGIDIEPRMVAQPALERATRTFLESLSTGRQANGPNATKDPDGSFLDRAARQTVRGLATQRSGSVAE